jgi:flagellar basal-body rod protein FlgB
MFLERLMNQTNGPLLEQVLEFTAARHRLIAENMANVDTPEYQQKDLDVRQFQAMLRDRVDTRENSPPGAIGFDDISAEVQNPTDGILFHDGNNRSMEQLVSDQAKNAMLHNLVVEMLRKQFQQMEMALKEKVT